MDSAIPGQGHHLESFTVQGMTGVDLALEIAGPGSRSFAFIIDWHIRLLAALAWLFAGTMATGGFGVLKAANPWSTMLVLGPPVVIYFLYHPIVELLMRGQTPGKRMAGVRVVNRDGSPPGAGAILIRNCFRMIDALPMLYAVGLACTFWTAQRVRIGDMAAGTLLVVRGEAAEAGIERLAASRNASGLDPATLDLVEQILDRWEQLDEDRRGDIARTLLQRIDAQLPADPAAMTGAQLHERLLQLAGRMLPA